MENDYYVAIQAVMTAYHEKGWDMDKVHELALDAAEEWLSEMETDKFDDQHDEYED